ncbi:hypothetical protein MMC19_006168 [Ptychographa xylographoides]|nr:hypothetical protein [Ptychographa xylographoides]
MSAGLGRESEDGRRPYSTSSPDLSSPPKSPESPQPPNAAPSAHSHLAIAYSHLPDHDAITVGGGPRFASAPAPANAKSHKAAAAVPAVKKPRKKREPATHTGSSTAAEAKEKKSRKPRAPPGTSNPAKKKIKTEPVGESIAVASTGSRQPKITELVASPPAPPPPSFNVLASAPPSQNGKSEAIASSHPPAPIPLTQSSPRSGQNYDPIRSSTVEPKHPASPFNPPQSSPLKSANRASASPSISSLIDPPNTSHPKYSFTQASHSQTSNSSTFNTLNPNTPIHFSASLKPHVAPQTSQYGEVQSRPPSSTSTSPVSAARNLLSTKPEVHTQTPVPSKPSPPPAGLESSAMDMDMDLAPCAPPSKAMQLPRKLSPGTGTGTHTPSSATHSPKPPKRDKDPVLPPLPSGNGLLTNALFGGPSDSSSGEKMTAPTVILHVPLNGEINKYVNFARMAEERYGFNALHPRLAAQRERLARVAAAGALLERVSNGNGGGQSGSGGASADEMSLELSDGEDGGGDTSNVEMGGMGQSETGTGTNGDHKKPARKRRMKEDQYDKEDPFVDDSELAWEEQAAASKDGFFVYSGPLVPEGEKPQVERANGTVKRPRGRGRGGGSAGGTSTRGSGGGGRGGAAASAGTTGTRGSGTTRKPRVTKAARALLEAEKADREKMAVLAAKPSGYQGVTAATGA